jgi:poly-gamma-glutamate synthesis protein (capsule biosynthesis protein)
LVVRKGGGEFSGEYAFLQSLFDNPDFPEARGFRLVSGQEAAGGNTPEPHLDFFSSWEFEQNFGDIPLSKTWYVPRADMLAGRSNAEPAACRDGREQLVPLSALAPPFVALRVGGMTAADADYPLVRLAGVSLGLERPSPDGLSGNFIGKKIRGLRNERAYGRMLKKIQALEAALQAVEKPLFERPPDFIWIASGGDLMLDRGASEILLAEGAGGIFGGTADFLLRADLALVNLEGVVSSRGTKVKKSFNFRFDPRIAGALRDAGIDGVLQANNHAFDYGPEAFLDSLDHLATAGVAVLGAGRSDDDAARPLIFHKGDSWVRVFGIGSFPREKNGWDGRTVAAAADRPGLLHAGRGGGEKLKQNFASTAGVPPDSEPLDIVLFHGGVEWSSRPDAPSRELYTDLIRHGADLVIGSHPHVVQGFEWVLGRPVFWSLGNYVFGGMGNTDGGEQGLFVHLGFWGRRLVYLEPYPLSLSHTRTTIAPAGELRRFYHLSRELRSRGEGEAVP